MSQSHQGYILSLRCPDTVGIVAAVARFLADRGCSIAESDQFEDRLTQTFALRAQFAGPAELHPLSRAELEAGFAPIARRFGMEWKFHGVGERPRIVIACSRQSHCLLDLLARWRSGWLKADIVGIASNHAQIEPLATRDGLPFLHLPVNAANKEQEEARLLDFMREQQVELLVLARWMQILTPQTCEALAGRCINIHHSFLPSFKGADPYTQAHARGVKIIGATAHYVTGDLDEGPIIEQIVERVAHHHTPQTMREIGQDLECTALARAVRWHIERRIMITGNKTIVFA